MEQKHDKRREQKPYIAPQVDTLEVRQLVEAVGPAQALSSGASTSSLHVTKDALMPANLRRTRGGRG